MKKKLISLLLSIAMLASLALPAMAEESTGTALDGYTDVDGTAWYAEAVTYVIENGIMGSTSTDAKLFAPDGTVRWERYVTMPEADRQAGYTHADNYVCSAESYRAHLIELFRRWRTQPEVQAGQWPSTLEECFGIEPRYSYPLSEADAAALADYFITVYAPGRDPHNHLEAFEGFIYEGPEYLTMFDGLGAERQTIPFPVPRGDDGLRWGDYAWPRIEPCNRVDRFLSAVAYLDGERPYLIVGRGYYTRATLTAYDFFAGRFHEVWRVDSGHVPMDNPFRWTMGHARDGSDPLWGALAGQGDHSLSAADIDGDGCMEIIFGAAAIDHDGSLLYSSFDYLPDQETWVRLGHGDSLHVADIDPDRPGLEIFNVFEEGENAPYGYALRDAEDGHVLFGEYFAGDLGRCMVGDVADGVRGLQCWVNDVWDCHGNLLPMPAPGTNARIYWAGNLTTQLVDGPDYLHQRQPGRVCDPRRGVLLDPQGTATNNGTKGNPCLVADLFGDWREELLLRLADNSAIRIYTSTEEAPHKLFTLMHDPQYRCGIAWQNNCYNQPVYPSFYYASDMDFTRVLPAMQKRPTVFLAGDGPARRWAAELPALAAGGALARVGHCADSPFAEETCHTLPEIRLDSYAAAGCNAQTFATQGRLDEIARRGRPGDFLLIRFDGQAELAAALPLYSKAARRAGMQAALLVPAGQAGAALRRAAAEYALPCLSLPPLPADPRAAARCVAAALAGADDPRLAVLRTVFGGRRPGQNL